MLKIKSQIKNLGLVVTLGLLSGTASAITLHSTYDYGLSGGAALSTGDWAAARFSAPSADCPNGCEVTSASLYLFDSLSFPFEENSLSGFTLSVYSDGGDGKSLGTKSFDLDNPDFIPGGGYEKVSFSVNDTVDTFLTKNTYYWLKFENFGRDKIEWSYDGISEVTTSEYQLSFEKGVSYEYEGLPFLFDVTGVPATASPVPVPGAVWMMGSGLFGLLAVSRRKSNKLSSAI